jgi:hypothetical protein
MRKIVFFPKLDDIIGCKDRILIDASIIILRAIIEIVYDAIQIQKIESSSKAKHCCVMCAVKDHSRSFIDDTLFHVIEDCLE